MSSGALRAAWEAAQTKEPAGGLRAAWDAANAGPFSDVEGGSSSTATDPETATQARLAKETWSQPAGPKPLLQALGTLASLGQVPGIEYAQGAAGALASHVLPGKSRSLAESMKDIEAAKASAPAWARVPAQIAGGTVAALAMPKVPGLAQGGVLRQGAQYGILKGLFGTGETVEDRLHDASKEGAADAIGGGIASGVGTAGRVALAKPLGAVAQRIDNQIARATIENYGKAAAEGEAVGGTTAAVRDVLERPRIKKFVDLVRTDEDAGMSDADVAREVSKLMSKQVRGLKSAMDVGGYDAAKDLEAKRLGSELKRLRAATAERGVETTTIPAPETAQSPRPSTREAVENFHTAKGIAAKRAEGTPAQQLARRALERHGAEGVVSPPLRGAPAASTIETETPALMPSFPRAVAEKARMEGERGAFETAADAAKRILNGSSVAGKRQLSKSPEAFAAAIQKMSPGEARAALQGTLGRAGENIGMTANPLTGFGLGSSAVRLNRLAPFINQLDEQAGNDWPAILRAIGIATP